MSNIVTVVGGGASGMMAAIVARRNGADITILERNDRVGKKLLATGNGRCNYTNTTISYSNFLENYHGNNPKFIYSALYGFDLYQTIDFFEMLGITPAVEDNKVYPNSFQASSVLDVLRYEIENLGINLITDAYVVDIKKNKNFKLKLKDGRTFETDKVILATGGMAMPVSGSDGNGYTIAKSFGHELIDIFPGLVQLKLEGNIFKQIKGIKFPGVAYLVSNNKVIMQDSGDILFTDYGISGPPILQISRTALDYLRRNEDIKLKVSIITNMDKDEMVQYLSKRFEFMPNKTIQEGLIGLINKRLIIPILKEINVDKDKNILKLSTDELEKLANILTSWEFKITGSQGWGQAQVTAGGIDTKDIDDKTMESKLIKGLYIIGELLDVDGNCGGFNLQWAWSSGYMAGYNAARVE
ncbi:MAG: NAD(P)/FAD-dependent oxidoreductase [Tissierellaceae bacterium]|nr:NAD(P)/FAD-dependent oxidoreductase [Tissierellaceae bacterium]